MTQSNRPQRTEVRLKDLCLQAVSRHSIALGSDALLGLPVPLIKDILFHLNILQLHELQPSLNQRGISTRRQWLQIIRNICGSIPFTHVLSEEEAKQKAMRTLFILLFYGIRNVYVQEHIVTKMNVPSLLRAAAEGIRDFLLIMTDQKLFRGLAIDQKPLLNLLERSVRSVKLQRCVLLSKREALPSLYVLHRLLDHGGATKLTLDGDSSFIVAWLLHGRGSQYLSHDLKLFMSCVPHAFAEEVDGTDCSQGLQTRSGDRDHHINPTKRPRLNSDAEYEDCTEDPQTVCQMFTGGSGPSGGGCPWGRIDCLVIAQCSIESLSVLMSALPTFFSLRSLTLHTLFIFSNSDVLNLASALKQLSDSHRSSLIDLTISILPHTTVMDLLLDACPSLTSLHVEIQTLAWVPDALPRPLGTELPLKELTIKVAELQTNLDSLTSVLRHCPHLASLYAAGIRLPTGRSAELLRTLSESNPLLRTVTLKDINLSECLPGIINLLRDCKLKELQFDDCRLLEKSSDRTASLQQLVVALRNMSSLHTLSLAQNRIANNVCVLAELFSGSSPSSVQRLDLSSNFIQSAELLEFTKRLRMDPPLHRLTLNLGKNPGDRDPDTWNTAIRDLQTYCEVTVERWTSCNLLADHVSNM